MLKQTTIIGLALVGAIGAATVANAADLQRAAPVYTKAPPPVEVFNWTGFYIGANIGYSSGRTDLFGLEFADPKGVIGGGQIGYNWQAMGSPWVFGVEVDGQGTGQDQSATVIVPGVGAVTATDSLPWFMTFRGRVGYAFAPMFMIYATGGGAVVDHKFAVTAGGLGTASIEDTRLGWTAGAGIEGAFYRNWSWKVEYLHIDTGSFNSNAAGVPLTWRVTDEIGRFGINYRF
jgi:outer membrane immunogenic protein